MPLDPLPSAPLHSSGVEEPTVGDDIALVAGPNADPKADVETYVGLDIRKRFEIYSYRHAAALLASSFKVEFAELQEALNGFRVTTREIAMPGGNESLIPKKLTAVLRPKNWVETRVQGDLSIRLQRTFKKTSGKVTEERTEDALRYENFIDGHKIDYVKGQH